MTNDVDILLAESIAMLFTARWNIPAAARHADLTDDEMKEIFSDYCSTNSINPIYPLSQ